MALNNPELTTNDTELSQDAQNQPQHSESRIAPVSIGDIFSIALRFWYWVLISVIVCLGIAWLKVKTTTPVYTRSVQLILRDNAQSTFGNNSVDFMDIGVGYTNTVLEDEMAAFKSPDLMAQVVKKLNLQVSYIQPGTWHDDVLYGSNLPVTVSFPDMDDDERASLHLNISPEGTLTVSDLEVNGRGFVIPNDGRISFGNAINTGSGRIIVTATPFYQKGSEYNIRVFRNTLQGATAAYDGKVSIELANKNSNVVNVTCSDYSVQRADEVLLDLVNTYNLDGMKARAEVVAATSNFITDRLNLLEKELGSVDSDISSFKSANLIPDLASASSMALQQSTTASTEISQLSNQLQMTRYVRDYLSNEGKNNVLPVNTGIGSTNIEALIGQFNAIMLQRNSLLTSTSESNPLVVDLNSRLAALRSSMLQSLDNQIVALTTSIGNLQRSEQTAIARVAANPRQAQFLLTAERQQKVKETLYLYLLQKREENELSEGVNATNTRIVRRPAGPGAPSEPKPMATYAIGLLVGLLIPFGAIYLLEAVNTRIRGRKDVEKFNIPVIGEIPLSSHIEHKWLRRFQSPTRQRDNKPVQEDILVKEGERNLINEAFRVLRTNISFITADSLPTVCMITSFNPGSGKTFVALNAGIALALKGKKVLLIDGDLRRASLSRVVGSPHKGLANYLNGSCRDINSLIVADSIQENLSILPVGTFPPNPTELLESSRFGNVVEYLRSEYDYVFIDCPPAEMLADAAIINKVCDRTFFVVRVDLFERSMLPELENIYLTKKYHNISVIVNGADTMSRYGTTYRYGYGYTSKRNYRKYGAYK